MRRSLGLMGALVVLVATAMAVAGALVAGAGAPVAARPACVADTEPNDQPSATTLLQGELCLDGTMAEGDQDLVAWEVTPADATTRWAFSLTGVEDAHTGLELRRITSDPGIEPPTPDASPILALAREPGQRDPVSRADVLVAPGRYVLGVFRSGPAGGVVDPSIAYHVSITRGAPLPPSVDVEPNDAADTGAPVNGEFSGSGDLASSDDHLRWTPEAHPATLWQVALLVPLGESVRMTVTTSDGVAWTTVATTDGTAVVHDLAVDPGGYDITISWVDADPLPYAISAAPEPADGPTADAEPNDQAVRALAIDPARPIARGRLATASDSDIWRLTVDESLAASQFDLRLIAPDGPARQVCLTDRLEASLQCRSGLGGAVLSNLFLPVGEYLIRVTGEADLDAPYVMRIDATSAPVADYETEPNDIPSQATPFDASVVMRGRAEADETDIYRLRVTGEPQLWQVVARGAGIGALDWVDGLGYDLGYGVVADDHTSATLYDLYLVPGEHRIEVQGDGGDYTLTAIPLGPPDPNAEREPNDEQARANRIGVGDTRTGHLRSRDTDWYRFSLAASEHITIDIDVPDTSAIVMELETGAQTIVETRGTAVGQGVHYDALVPAGEYVLWLRSTQSSEEPYRLGLGRGDPFARAGDLEPNDAISTARVMPPSGVVEGSGWGGNDPDYYRLPSVDPGTLAVDVEGDLAFLELIQGDTRVSLRQADDGPTWTTDEAVAGDGYLVVTGLGDYTLRLPGAHAPPRSSSATIELLVPTETVAAWWPSGQHLDAVARVTNLTSLPQDATLDTWTSHSLWSATPERSTITLAPGAMVEVPIAIDIGPEAWAGTPVALGVRASLGADDAATGWVTVTPTGEATPVGARQAWDVPPALLGGIDVASTVMGAVSDGAIDPAGEVYLHDGQAIGGATLSLPVTDPVTATTVDLAGDEALPIVGIVIDPASGLDSLSEKPRGFELWLSEDGVTWTSVLTGEVSPLGIDQPFVLPATMPAGYARLAITSTWAATLLGSTLGPFEAQVAEWKVIAAPGVDPVAAPRDIADPVLGGHVVDSQPLFSELPDVVRGVLDADPTGAWMYPPEGAPVTWVVGFLNDRAAQVTALGWEDPAGSDPASRARRVTLEVSTESPLGPWLALGTWDLDRADDGTVSPFQLESPTWARYIRFSAAGPRSQGAAWELPGRLSVLERPTDEAYRSIIAEWGQSRPMGPYEQLEPPGLGLTVDDPDAGEGDTAPPLAAHDVARGRVAIGTDADEYRIDIPADQHSIRFVVTGEPVVGVRVRLFGPDGLDVPLALVTDAGTGGDVYQANVTPGARHRVRVEQPPFSAVLMYDTSLSIAAYWRPITQGLMAFAGDVQEGRDRVMIMPFGAGAKPLLRDWTDDAYQLLSALEANVADGDSSTEASVLHALEVLTARQGARAILLVTDGETSSFAQGPAMWQGLAHQRPLIYTVHLGGTPGDQGSTHLLQDLAASSGGAYAYVRTQDEMDRAFDRMATSLRRPAGYSLSYATSTAELPPPEPAALSVVTPPGPDGTPIAAPIDSHTALEIVLDTSSSMRAKLGRTTRIAAAKDVLVQLVTQELPSGIPVALRWFRQAKGSCDTELAVPLGPLVPDTMAAIIDGIRLQDSVRTPLAAAIEAVTDDLASVTGPRIVVVVSDGKESCTGDPEAAVRALRAQGVDVTVNVVGIGLSKEDRKRIRRLARLGGGSYFDAKGAGQLDDAIRGAVSAPYEARDARGAIVARGVVNGPALKLPPGTYRVVVLTSPPHAFEAIVLESSSSTTLTLPAEAASP